jgi:heat shock protein HslJ
MPSLASRLGSPRRWATFAAAVLLLASAGCGGSDDEPAKSSAAPVQDAADLEGNTYASTDVSGHDLVEGTTILVAFDDDTLSVAAGCNTQYAPYSLDGDTLQWTDKPTTTAKECSSELTAQDEWLAQLFTDGAKAAEDGSALTLSNDDVTVELRRSHGFDLTTLLGKTWTVVGTITDGTTRRLPVGGIPQTPTIRAAENGFSRVNTGCNTGRTRIRVAGDEFVFGPTTTTRQRCRQPANEIERRILAVLDGRTHYVFSDGPVLVVETRRRRTCDAGPLTLESHGEKS